MDKRTERINRQLAAMKALRMERDIEILRLRAEEGLTLQEIGDALGLTRERVRQIVEKTSAEESRA